ncbi:MAG: tetratricopeptide repeat protein [Desulfovibrionaceae bacterium]
MSAELAKARKHLSLVRTLLKEGKYLPAAQAIQFGIATMLKSQLLKVERDEFEKLIATAVDYFANDDYIRARAAITLTYAPGQERIVYDLIREIADALKEQVVEAAQEQLRLSIEKRNCEKKEKFAHGIATIEAGDPQAGEAMLSALVESYPDDPELRGSVGEALLRVGLYEPAVDYLTEALDQKPDMLHLYNSIGIALRRLNRFEVAESYYLRASQYLRKDPNLYFNIGRLYVDWKKWDKALKAAAMALKLKPGFMEAQKMYEYAEKQKQAEAQ